MLVLIKYMLITIMVKSDQLYYKSLSRKSFIIMLIIRTFIAISSNIILSSKGKQLRQMIILLRKLATNLDSNKLLNNKLKSIRYYIYLIYGFLTIFCIYYSLYTKDTMLYTFIAELFLLVALYSSDFYVIYLTSYIPIIQDFFNSHLTDNYSNTINFERYYNN